MTRIAIVGAGPKAAAIAAKSRALRECGHASALEVHAIDRARPGAAWSGGYGYSDGSTPLCTPALRDLGFPYASHPYGRDVAEFMLAHFSWTRFLISRGDAYARWVDRGCPAPSHRLFADYIDWAIQGSADRLITEEVVGLKHTAAGWRVRVTSGGLLPDAYDAVVITGSGPPVAPLAGATMRVLDGENLWRSESLVRMLLDDPENPVVVIGAGGTSAAAVSWLMARRFERNPIWIVGSQATLHARIPNAFENRLFGDDDAWALRSLTQQQQFLDRLDAGAVWAPVLERIADHGNLSYFPGRADHYATKPAPSGRGHDLWVVVKRGSGPNVRLPAALAVDCRGFDGLWFRQLLERPAQAALDALKQSGVSLVDGTFAVRDPFPHPGLHVPGSGAAVGPAARNLMALGWMADKLIRKYAPP
ncbi:FAD/NAD(P)-binding protein [Methylobacterium sp. 391_Methyba4]|uniref:FAD/NAD(P)-binding protein n=1 Tax=Methylobacterium sp. 391_Methyba4 TaxID=3038924 RepID=UPI00241E4E3B|nr:FAD/NAD(P)-binding protein [Methylobacterium sp. 391_Methyba4]WFS09600.1 FAD/NAD(P)-binding protein [Methylobacterium sp. 391_Methyba4]